MAKRLPYEPVLSAKAAAFLVVTPKVRQRRLIQLLVQLAANPHQVGDYGEPDETGREVQFIRIRDLLIAFWPDDAVKEIRIVDIEEI